MVKPAPSLHSHQVDIFYDFQPTPICSGTILSSYLILTLANCLTNKSVLKLTVQTQKPIRSHSQSEPQPESSAQHRLPNYDHSYEDEEQENFEKKDNQNHKPTKEEVTIETRYVEDFYPIKALTPNGTFESEHQLALVVLEKELNWTASVNKARLLIATDKLSQIYQPYKCFNSSDVEENSPVEASVKETAFSDCTRNAEDTSSRLIFPSGCLSDTPRSSGQDHHLVCPAPLPGSGLFCNASRLPPGEKDHLEFGKNIAVLCGVLASDGPIYINVTNYLPQIFLPEDQDDDDSDDSEENDENEVERKPVAIDLENYYGLEGTSFGGTKVNFYKESFPYQLSLQEFRKGMWEHICGAVLLDVRTALTAAHCFDSKKPPANFQLVAGMRALGENATEHQIRSVQNIQRHFKYVQVLQGYDIALVTVNGSFILNENVNCVWISSQDDPILSEYNGTATGWGITWGNIQNSSGLSKDLLSVNLPLRPHEDCKGLLSFFKDSMICSRSGTSNMCSGDSGGPLVLKNYEFPGDRKRRDLLVGISSFGPTECEDVSKPSGFTKVSSFYNWLLPNWKRITNKNKTSNSTTKKTFTCFNGDEINFDWRCDEELDCADGSDEKGCNRKPTKEKEIPKTRSCGGEIKLGTDEHDIIYRVESSKPGKMSFCVWTILNQKNNPIELKLLNNIDAHFDPEQNQLFALHNFTLQNFNYESIKRPGQNIKVADSYITLIFRGPAGIRDSGFHLRLKGVENSPTENPLKFTRMDLTPTPTLQIHSYPPGNGNYGANERVFTVLSPVERGGRIKLNVTFGAMEPRRDWFDIISIGQTPKSLFRLSQRKGPMNETVVGGRNELLLVFMSTGGPGNLRKGIKFTYFEERPTSTDAQEIGCGGNLTLNGNADLFYKAKPSHVNCLWVISKARVGASLITLLDSRSETFNLTDGSSSLYILHNFTRRDSLSHHIDKFEHPYRVDQPFFVLYFRSSPFSTTNGFFLRLRTLVATSAEQHLLQLGTTLTSNSSRTKQFAYPRNSSRSSNSKSNSNSNSSSNGGAIILVQPTQNTQKVHLNLKSIHLPDLNEEWLEVLTFRERPVSIYRTSGSRNITDKSFISSEGEPFVIYLKSKSNSSNLQEKKKLVFSYYEEQEIVKESESCGGVINLGRRHQITYRAPPGQRSYCLWLVHNAHGPHSNITASFDTTNSQLITIQDQKITNLGRDETIQTESSVAALLFRSNGHANVDLTINLNGTSDFGAGFGSGSGENSLETKVITLEAKSQQIEEFTYPPPPALTYENNERVFILITPKNGTRNQVQLNLTFVDTEPTFDKLTLLNFTQSRPDEIEADRKLQVVFEFASYGEWTNNIFVGEPGEPFLLHFNSDSDSVKSGFKFNYKTIPSNGA